MGRLESNFILFVGEKIETKYQVIVEILKMAINHQSLSLSVKFREDGIFLSHPCQHPFASLVQSLLKFW